MATNRVTMLIDPQIHKRLKELCLAHGLKVAYVADRAIEREIERIESAERERSERIHRANSEPVRAR